MKFSNSAGKVYYGMHFYPGVAEYRDNPNQEGSRVFLNEDTIRQMDPSFAGRPIFVEHVDEVEQDIDKLKNEADGWVIESFFNPADGKHWAKFIVVSERGERAIQAGFKLSNAYIAKSFGSGGLWNGVDYAKEVTSGEFEHLAIVRNPRYEESRILTPDEFKTYNSDKQIELKRLANSKDEKEIQTMKLKFWNKAQVEDTTKIESLTVTLPKSGKEVPITKLVNDADDMAMNADKEVMANGDHKVMVGESKMSVNELLEAHKKMNEEMAALKQPKNEEKPADEMMNEEDEEAKKKAAAMAEEKKQNEEKESEEKKKNAADEKQKRQAHFESLKNAQGNGFDEVVRVETVSDQVARGKARYGSK